MSATYEGPALTGLALDQIALLRRLKAQDFANKAELAADLGRDQSNLNKTLKRLDGEGIVDASATILTPRGQAAFEEYARMVGATTTGYSFRSYRVDELEPDALNPRTQRSFDRIAELKDGIVQIGRVLEPILVRQPAEPGGKPRIKAGVTRWEAARLAIAEGELPADFAIPAEYRESSDTDTRREATAENDQRADLNHIERAHAYEALVAQDGMTNAEVARLVGRTPEYVQQHRRLLRLSPEDQAKVAAKELSLHQALRDLAGPREVKAWEPTPQHQLVLAEVADAIRRRPMTLYPNSVRAGRSAQFDALLSKLVSESYGGVASSGDGCRVWLSDQGRTAANILLGASPLEAIQQRAGMHSLNGAYATDWLPDPEPERSAPRPAPKPAETPSPAPEQDDDGDDDDSLSINRTQLLMLVETHHAAMAREGATSMPGWALVTPAIRESQEWASLINQGAAATLTGPEGMGARLMGRGIAYLMSRGLNPVDNPFALSSARESSLVAHGAIAAAEARSEYVIDWLNPPPAAPEPLTPAAGPGEGAVSPAAPSPTHADVVASARQAAADLKTSVAEAIREEEEAVRSQIATPTRLMQARAMLDEVMPEVAEYLVAVANDGDFDWTKASLPEVAERIAFYFAGETALGVIGAAAALWKRGGDIFSERNLRTVWDQVQRRALLNAALVPELDRPVTLAWEVTATGEIYDRQDNGLIAEVQETVDLADTAAMAAGPELLRALRGLLAVAPRQDDPDDDDVEAAQAWRYAQEVARQVAQQLDATADA